MWTIADDIKVYSVEWSAGKPVGTPDASAFWRVIEQHKVNALFTAPTALRAIKREDPDGLLPNKFDLKSLKTIFLAGERADPDTIKWSEQVGLVWVLAPVCPVCMYRL